MMRLDKWIASVSDYSRSDVKKLVKSKKVVVDGQVAKDPGLKVADDAAILVNGLELRDRGFRYFMVHKPADVVCTHKKDEGERIFDLIEEDNVEKLQVVGRLDSDTTGLVILTDDGKWIHQVISPNKECPKVYHIKTADPLDAGLVKVFADGIVLKDEEECRPAKLEIISDKEAHLTLTEGKYHQVKRMFGACGNKVTELCRHSIGGIILDAELEEGDYRPLSENEIQCIL